MTNTINEEEKRLSSTRQVAVQPGAFVNDYSDYIKEYNRAQEEAAIADIENAYAKNTAAIDRAEKGIPVQYEGARNQAAGNAARAQRNNDLYAAAAGLGAGTGAQARLATGVALQNNLNDINKAEASAKADIELQRTQLAADYENAIAKAKANGNATLADALYKEYVRADESLVAQNQYLRNMKLTEQQYQNGLIRQQAQDNLAADKYADQLAQQEFDNWYKQQTLNTERELNGLTVLPQYGATGDGVPVVTPPVDNYWNNVKNEVFSIMQNGNEEEVRHYVGKVYDTLTPEQRKELSGMLTIAGYIQ